MVFLSITSIVKYFFLFKHISILFIVTYFYTLKQLAYFTLLSIPRKLENYVGLKSISEDGQAHVLKTFVKMFGEKYCFIQIPCTHIPTEINISQLSDDLL